MNACAWGRHLEGERPREPLRNGYGSRWIRRPRPSARQHDASNQHRRIAHAAFRVRQGAYNCLASSAESIFEAVTKARSKSLYREFPLRMHRITSPIMTDKRSTVSQRAYTQLPPFGNRLRSQFMRMFIGLRSKARIIRHSGSSSSKSVANFCFSFFFIFGFSPHNITQSLRLLKHRQHRQVLWSTTRFFASDHVVR